MLQGTVKPGFDPVRTSFASLWNQIEVGAALTVFLEGEPVVNLWGGHLDQQQKKHWQEKTLVNTYSASKGIVAIGLACLVADGLLDYEQKVAHYWPQFGAQQKFDITVAELLAHQAGLYQFEPAVSANDLFDWQARVAQLSRQKPVWMPGSISGYHAITWGYLAGELIHRITGMLPGEFIQLRVAKPLMADFHIGVPAEELQRCADVIGPNHARKPIKKQTYSSRSTLLSNDPVLAPFNVISQHSFRQAQIPATNGHGSAMGLARCYQGVLDASLFNATTLRRATQEDTRSDTDQVLGQRVRRSMGFILNGGDIYFGPSAMAFGHPGTGGTTAFADPETGITFAYVTNQLHYSGSVRANQLIDTVYHCLSR